MLIRRFPTGVRAAAACCLFVALASTAGCGLPGPDSERTSSYRVTQPVTRLVVRDSAGDVHVSVGTGTTVDVVEHQNYRGAAPKSTHTVSDGTLTLTYSCPSGDCGIDYTVTVPAGLGVEVDAAAGDVAVSGLRGATQVQADAGDVTLSDLGGAVQVQADAGDIRATGIGSSHAKLVASAGDVTLGFTAAPVNLSVLASAGNVEVTLPGDVGYAVTATADAGDTHVTVPTSPGSAHVVRAESDSGDVSVLAAG